MRYLRRLGALAFLGVLWRWLSYGFVESEEFFVVALITNLVILVVFRDLEVGVIHKFLD